MRGGGSKGRGMGSPLNVNAPEHRKNIAARIRDQRGRQEQAVVCGASSKGRSMGRPSVSMRLFVRRAQQRED